MKASLLLALVSCFLLGCGGKGEKSAVRGTAAPDSLPVSLYPVTDDSTLVDARVDSNWVRVSGIDRAARLLDREGAWAVDYGWLHLVGKPGTLFTIAQLDSLEKRGEIDSTTAVGFVWYREVIEAGDPARLQAEAMRRRPTAPPPTLQRALDNALRTPLGGP